ncbi:hypothetical protein L873DRAFT_1815752 [Choiromyces venosus 120613-1]|uniref:Uncharacterized protein n=1 Tax=Choiromyces venosus 120613-1 TaxID=1336337 RepID=A0A3N4JA82_9PEZI|nr:hypothetical protein L873DRAFT_1815752 [Choiromyces venosus 120613-1]
MEAYVHESYSSKTTASWSSSSAVAVSQVAMFVLYNAIKTSQVTTYHETSTPSITPQSAGKQASSTNQTRA